MQRITIFLFLFCMLCTANSYPKENQKTSLELKSGTLVLVHGFMCGKMNMSALENSLKKDGWVVINWSYPSRNKWIEEHAEDLVSQLKIIANNHPDKPISFVTHSMGGLVVRHALNQPDCPIEAKMGRAILVAPPNQGSSFARSLQKYKLIRRLVGEKSGQQLITNPGFDALGNFPKGMPVLIIAGTASWNPTITDANDGQVSVKETCLKTPHHHVNCYAGHSWICFAPTVIKTIKTFLSLQEFSCNCFSGEQEG